MSSSSSESHVVRHRLQDGVRRMARMTAVTRSGVTQFFYRWRPIRLPHQYIVNGSDSDSTAPPDGVQSDIDEDVIDLGSIASCSLNFEWVDLEDDDPRNYSLYVHREFHVDATRRELELARRVDDMEAALLSLSGSLPPRSRQNVRNTVATVFAGFRELLAEEFREHRRLFEFSS